MPTQPVQLFTTLLYLALLSSTPHALAATSPNALLAPRAMMQDATSGGGGGEEIPPLLRSLVGQTERRSARRQVALMMPLGGRDAEAGEQGEKRDQEVAAAASAVPAVVAALPAPPPAAAPPPPAAPASTWPTGSPDAGKTWTLSPHFASFAEFNVLKWSSGADNSHILTDGLPPYAFAQPVVVPSDSVGVMGLDGEDARGEDGGMADGMEGMEGGEADGEDATGEDGEDSEEENEESDNEEEEEEDDDDRRLQVVAPIAAVAAVESALQGPFIPHAAQQALTSLLSPRQPVPLKPHQLVATAIESATSQSALQAGQAVIQTFYPSGSSNPGGDLVGGSQFYSLTKLDLKSALTVTLAYSVFFPASFDWVKGGKLPGLYGGRESCSGGDTARDCWSARFMWREEGMGELYLYVPQDKQDPSICSVPPQSMCNGAYGVSLGRGAFTFKRGAWTTVKQTISLGSGATTDGSVVVEVDGKTVISFAKVFFPSAHKGLFFSTFFGGNGDDWATPRDQAVYFKGFSISVLR